MDKNKKNLLTKIPWALIFYSGFLALFFFFGLEFYYGDITNKETMVKTEAEVIYVKYDYEYKDKYDDEGNRTREKIDNCNTTISYVANDKVYSSELGSKSCSYKKGEKLEMYYDKDDPNSIYFPTSKLFVYFWIILSIVGNIGWYMFLYKDIKKGNFKKNKK